MSFARVCGTHTQLLVRDGEIVLSPDLGFVEEAVLNSFEDIITAAQV